MKKTVLSLVAAVTLTAGAAANPYENPALNPVKFEPPPSHEPLKLIENGKLNFVIAADLAAEKHEKSPDRASVKLAVEALTDGLERTTGIRPVVVAPDSPEAKKARYVIAVGKSAITDKLGLKPLDLPPEGFLVKSFPGGVVIAGHDGSLKSGSYDKWDWVRYRINGSSNGAYDFLERVLGMRYYYPGIGVVAPKIADLTLKPLSYSDAPVYKNRFNWGYSIDFRRGMPWKQVKNDSRDFDKAYRMAMSTRFNDVCHSPSPQNMAKAFPDKLDTMFYTDKHGFRYFNPATHIGNLFDVTNPKFAELLVDSFKKFYDTDGKWMAPWKQDGKTWYPPNSEYVLFGQADTFADMENESNKHLFPASRKDSRSGANSDLYSSFYIQLGRMMKEKLPGKKLGVLAYHRYTLPPVVCTEWPDNIRVQVCMGRLVMTKNPASRKMWQETYSGWHKVLKHPVSAWIYGAQGSAFTQAIQGRYMPEFLQLLDPWLWRDGVFYDASGLRWIFYYSYYPVYRAFWNPAFNVDAALNEHWTLLYGPKAGAELKAFYDLLVARWEKVYIGSLKEAGNTANSNAVPELLYKAYDIPTVDQLEKHLKAALAATAPGSVERQRVEYFAQPWEKDFIAARTYCNLVTPVYQVKRLNDGEKVVIDGKGGDPAWKRAADIPMADAKGRGLELPSKPEAKMLWSKDGIYLLLRAHGKPAVNKGDLWFGSDNMEFFLSPGNDKEIYFQFAASPGGEFHDAFKREKPMETGLDPKWECKGVRHAATFSDKEWCVELFIPFSGLQTAAPKAYSTWSGNVINNKYSSDFRNFPGEYSSFSPTMGNNHNLALFGKFKFMGKGD